MSSVSISDSYQWGGEVRQIAPLLDALFAFAPADFSIHYVAITGALKIELVSSRATAQPGELFWLIGSELICSGDANDYREAQNLCGAAG